MLYRLLSSLKTSVYILAFMGLIFLIGTIFPQGENILDYIKAGGKYVAVVRALDLLDIFGSPLFFIVTGILLLNLAVCLFDRLKLFLKTRRIPMDFEMLKAHPNAIVFQSDEFEKRLMKTGFKLKASAQDGSLPEVKIYEKGLQYWWLSWFYHIGIILAILGFVMTYLFAFEKEVLLYPGKPEKISLYSKETKWNEFLKKAGVEVSEENKKDEYTLSLKEFVTEYYQGLKLDYPKEKLERLAIGTGVKKIKPSEKGFSYMPKMWLTGLDVKKPDGQALAAKLWVNKPFRTGSLTLYQMGYEQKVNLAVNGEMLEAEVRVPFEVKDIQGKFVLGPLKLGTLYKRDGTTEEISPATTLNYMPEKASTASEELGEIKPGEKLNAKGATFEFRDYKEGSYLSYRKDPGVWLVGFACLFVFLGLFIRSLGAWYRVHYASEEKTAYVLISTRGILADKDRIIKKLQR